MFINAIERHKEILEIRQIGLMLGVELKSSDNAGKLMELFLNEGIIVDQFLFNHVSFRIAPPLNITKEEIQEVSKLIISCLDRL